MSASVDHTPLNQQQIADIERLVARYRSERGALLPLLHAIRDELGYVPDVAVPFVAEGLNLSRADVHGVLTFYHDFRRAPAGRHIVKLCRAEACQARGGAANEIAVAERLGVAMGETRADREVTLEAIYCLGLCANGPSALVDGVPLANATPDAVLKALSPSGVSGRFGVRPGDERSAGQVGRGGVSRNERSAGFSDSPLSPTLSPEGERGIRRVYISDDMASIALGADKVAAAFVAAGCAVVRTGSRGLFRIEPLVEIDGDNGRVGFGPVTPDDVAAVLDGTHANALGDVGALPFFSRQQRFTFARVGLTDPLSLTDYAAHDGWKGLNTARAMAPNDVVAQVKASGLRGRGGAGFPTGIKWQTVLDAKGPEKFIVCNADEGDSGTFADRMLMESDPYCLIEGMAIAGHAVGAAYGYIYCRSEYPHAIAKLEAAIRRSAHIVAPFALEVRTGAGAYVCGEETALLDSIEGKRGQVRAKPPLPAHVGLFGKPTVINNVLSLGAVPFIMAEGAQAYADVGFGRSRGTMPVQLAGNIRNGGLFEIGFGITLGELVDEIGGGTESGQPVKAVQVGGPLGAYFPPSMFHMPFDYETFAQNGGLIGHAGITVFDDKADMAHMARFAMEFCSVESCGKCTPCRIGSTRGVETMDRIIAGGQRGTDQVEALPQIRNARGGKRSVAQEVEILRDLCDTMKYGSLCALGGFTPYPVLSALDFFPEDFGLAPGPAEAAE